MKKALIRVIVGGIALGFIFFVYNASNSGFYAQPGQNEAFSTLAGCQAAMAFAASPVPSSSPSSSPTPGNLYISGTCYQVNPD